MTRRPIPAKLTATFIILLLVSGCARAVAIGSDPGPVYSINVQNTLNEDMIVSYDAGAGPAILGTVTPNRTERFVITTRAGTVITVSAINAAGTRRSGPYTVQLQADAAPQVTLR